MSKPWELDEGAFRGLGLKVGLEIHQQLDTVRKLFCHCPVGLRDEQPDVTLLRHMRPTLSELGEYDGTALMEFKTKKRVIYQVYSGYTCTYEMDDTPPFELNPQALDIALQLAMTFNCSLVDEIHISRKQYLDGSIPTGFQRTAVVGVNGWVPYRGRRIRITHLTLEEDACREVSDRGHTIVFKADRLSTPLVEVITAADMHTPKEAMKVDELLGRVLRSSGGVRRGIGSVRQDVNVSIEGGERVEIKGVPKTLYIERLVAVEALRQKSLLKIRDKLRGRGISPQTLRAKKEDITQWAKRCRSHVLKKAISSGSKVRAIGLGGFGGLLGHPTQPGITFAGEFSGRVKVIACLDSNPNLLHSDDRQSWGMTEEDWNNFYRMIGLSHIDALLMVWGNEEDTETALEEIRLRALEALEGVPRETRQAFPDGTTGFERILPGPDRMYPDTDSPPTKITQQRLRRLRRGLPPPLWERERRYRQMGLSEELIKPLAISRRADLFDRIVEDLKVSPLVVAVTIVQVCRHLRRKGFSVDSIPEEKIYRTFELLSKGVFTREILPAILERLSQAHDKEPDQCLVELNLKPISRTELKRMIREVVKDNDDAAIFDSGKNHRFLMGRIMEKVKGRIEGKVVDELLREELTTEG